MILIIIIIDKNSLFGRFIKSLSSYDGKLEKVNVNFILIKLIYNYEKAKD